MRGYLCGLQTKIYGWGVIKFKTSHVTKEKNIAKGNREKRHLNESSKLHETL